MMMTHVCGLKSGEFIHPLVVGHLYNNHFCQAREQLTRKPGPLRQLRINPDVCDITGFTFDNFELIDYLAESTIRVPIAV